MNVMSTTHGQMARKGLYRIQLIMNVKSFVNQVVSDLIIYYSYYCIFHNRPKFSNYYRTGGGSSIYQKVSFKSKEKIKYDFEE